MCGGGGGGGGGGGSGHETSETEEKPGNEARQGSMLDTHVSWSNIYNLHANTVILSLFLGSFCAKYKRHNFCTRRVWLKQSPQIKTESVSHAWLSFRF